MSAARRWATCGARVTYTSACNAVLADSRAQLCLVPTNGACCHISLRASPLACCMLHVACCMLHFSFLAELSAVEATSALFMPMTVLSLPMAALAGLLTDRHGQQIIV